MPWMDLPRVHVVFRVLCSTCIGGSASISVGVLWPILRLPLGALIVDLAPMKAFLMSWSVLHNKTNWQSMSPATNHDRGYVYPRSNGQISRPVPSHYDIIYDLRWRTAFRSFISDAGVAADGSDRRGRSLEDGKLRGRAFHIRNWSPLFDPRRSVGIPSLIGVVIVVEFIGHVVLAKIRPTEAIG